jgi:hypothetical protein
MENAQLGFTNILLRARGPNQFLPSGDVHQDCRYCFDIISGSRDIIVHYAGSSKVWQTSVCATQTVIKLRYALDVAFYRERSADKTSSEFQKELATVYDGSPARIETCTHCYVQVLE